MLREDPLGHVLGANSCARLEGVHSDLVGVVRRAIGITTQDFAVHCGTRTLEAQRRHVADGTSWTLDSKHLRQADGFAHAVDLVPWIGSQLCWDWPACYLVASAMSRAADALNVRLVWGGVWDRSMAEYDGDAEAIRRASEAYVDRRRRAGRRAAIDGPHFELG